MATFQARIEDHVGTLASADTTFMADVLTAGARLVIDRLADKSSDKIELYAVEKSDGGSGEGITAGRIISAHKNYQPARRIPIEMKARALDANSIHYALATDPVWFIEMNNGYVLPGGGTLRYIPYPTVTSGLSIIEKYPPEGYDAMILYASVRYMMRILSDLTTSTIGGLSGFSSPLSPAPPALPSFTYVNASAAIVGLAEITFTGTLTFTPPVFGGAYINIKAALGNQDVELAMGYNSELQAQLSQYSQDIQNAVAKFQEDLQEYQSGLQIKIENARLESQKLSQQAQIITDVNLQNAINSLNEQVQEYQALLGKYQIDTGIYGNQIQKESLRIQSLLSQYQLMSTNYLQILENLKKEFQSALESL